MTHPNETAKDQYNTCIYVHNIVKTERYFHISLVSLCLFIVFMLFIHFKNLKTHHIHPPWEPHSAIARSSSSWTPADSYSAISDNETKVLNTLVVTQNEYEITWNPYKIQKVYIRLAIDFWVSLWSQRNEHFVLWLLYLQCKLHAKSNLNHKIR